MHGRFLFQNEGKIFEDESYYFVLAMYVIASFFCACARKAGYGDQPFSTVHGHRFPKTKLQTAAPLTHW